MPNNKKAASNRKPSRAKIQSEKNKSNNNKSKETPVDALGMKVNNDLILTAIEASKDGSACVHGRGPECSVSYVRPASGTLPHKELKLTKKDLIHAYGLMLKTRITDDKHSILIKQGKSFFHIACSGHEAAQIAIGLTLKPGYDWGWTYYRDLAFVYALGFSAKEYFLHALGKAADPASGGRQMPNHYGHKKLNLPAMSSSTGTQFLNAVGSALASRKSGSDEITYVASGEGTTSQGEFYEAVNWASREKLPVMFCVQDNGYAISVPKEKQSMGTGVGHSFCCYSNLQMKTYDGWDYFASIKAAREASDYLRSGKGPVLLHPIVERLVAHSSSDDQRKYRPDEEIKIGKERKDPIVHLSNYLIDNKIATESELNELEVSIKQEVGEAFDWAESQPDPDAADSTKHIFSAANSDKLNYSNDKDYSDNKPDSGQQAVLVDAINHALKEEMARNDKMLIFGEDIEDPKGGVFTTTRGLSDAFGTGRVFNSPLAEASIIGVAIGLAVKGYKPVVEIQFGDYIWPAFQQIKNELATMRYRSNGNFAAPVVVRVAVGGYIHGGLCHSQNIESIFAHIPGLKIAYPSNAADAKGLLKAACRMDDPVIFCEHKGMYRLPFARTIEPDENYLLSFGKARIVRRGDDATIVTYGMGVRDSVNAAKNIEKDTGKSIEIIDLRTIIPWDVELVLESVRKTSRVLVVHEDTITGGFGGEISATIAQEAFGNLDAPVMRLAAKDSHIPYAPVYEKDVLPNSDKIIDELNRLLDY